MAKLAPCVRRAIELRINPAQRIISRRITRNTPGVLVEEIIGGLAWVKAVALDPRDEKSRYFLGRLFYEANLPNEAAAWLRKALKLAPNEFQARTYLGLCTEAGAVKTQSVCRSMALFMSARRDSFCSPRTQPDKARYYADFVYLLQESGDFKKGLIVVNGGIKRRRKRRFECSRIWSWPGIRWGVCIWKPAICRRRLPRAGRRAGWIRMTRTRCII